VVLSAILLGTLLGTLGNSMGNLAIPAVEDYFSLPLSSAVWIVTIYTVVFSVLMPVCGDLGSLLGYRRIYLVGTALAAAAYLASGLAPTFPFLIGARVVLGIGIAPTLPAVMALIARTFTAGERGRAMGYWALVNGAGHALGPLVSGFLIQHLGWRSVFIFCVPIALANILLVWRLVPRDGMPERRRFDPWGAALLTASALGMMVSLTSSARLGWNTPLSLGLWVFTAAGLAAFVWVERRSASPMVDLSLFANRRFTSAVLVISAESFVLFGLLLAIPVFLIQDQGWQSQSVGIVTLSLTLVMALTAPFAGRLVDRRGSRLPAVLGVTLMGLGGFALLAAQGRVHPGQVGWLLGGCLAVTGVGMGMVQSPVTASVIQAVHSHQVGVATGIFHMVRFIVGSLGSTVFGLILETTRGGIAPGFQSSLLVILAAAGVALVAALGIARKGENRSQEAASRSRSVA